MIFEAEFGFGDRVWIDGDRSLTATVVAVSFSGGFDRARIQYEVSWIANGVAQVAWVDQFRLSLAR
jgi:hypothetical protein